jgi:hypothetical protein
MRLRLALLLSLLAVLLLASLGPLGPAGADDDDDDDPPTAYPLSTFPPSDADNVVLQWNNEALECIRAVRTAPVVNARGLFIIHSAAYDAWAAYDAKAVGTRLGGSLRRPSAERTLANKSQAISHAAYRAASWVWPGCQADWDAQLQALGYGLGDATTAATVGRTAADAVIAHRANDGANQLGDHPGGNGTPYSDYTGYAPVNPSAPAPPVDPWRWQPQSAAPASTPHWRHVTPFSPNTIPDTQVPDPPRSVSQTADDILRESAGLDDRKKSIAVYWADGPGSETPPGHWNLIAQWLSRRHRQTLDQDARMFLALNGGLLDASIAAWECKYRFDFARPVSVVRHFKAGRTVTAWRGPYLGVGPIQGETWRPYIPTPNFPEYTSGHSTFSAAAAAVLKDFRGADTFNASATIRKGTSFVEPATDTQPGVPATDQTISWARFEDAANQAGLSRRYGGIHWQFGDVYARDNGKKTGEGAFSLAKKLWEGG